MVQTKRGGQAGTESVTSISTELNARPGFGSVQGADTTEGYSLTWARTVQAWRPSGGDIKGASKAVHPFPKTSWQLTTSSPPPPYCDPTLHGKGASELTLPDTKSYPPFP